MEQGIKSQKAGLNHAGLTPSKQVYWNLSPAELVEHSLRLGEGVLSATGALAIDTGKFTGRSPEDKFFVRDAYSENLIWWGDVNKAVSSEVFDGLHAKLTAYLNQHECYVRDVYACADSDYRLKVRVVSTKAFASMFVNNMFIRPDHQQLLDFVPDYTVLHVPEFEAVPEVDGTRMPNFAIINLTKKTIIIGGTGYTGEIKKGVFSILNLLLPTDHNVLAMHCSANEGENGDTAVFFGLSGTGKTTLSADPDRYLIGDDEHGWGKQSIFNFEGGCYAKTINLSKEGEPEIWDAIKFGAILENIRFFPGTRIPDYADKSVTENTRVSYPLEHIAKVKEVSVGAIPQNIFFLACDAYGVLPPISKLNESQAMFHFISGYTARVAGTEVGVTEPKAVFSACFGAPFMPLHPTKYASMLGQKLMESGANVWLVNTGWSGGGYGVGSRMKLKYTRALISSALEGKLAKVDFVQHPIFGVMVPQSCEGVPTEILNPKGTWSDASAYDAAANKLAGMFLKNFEKFSDFATEDIMAGAPKASVEASV